MLHPLFRLSSSRRVFIFLVIPIVLSLLLVARFANVGSAENNQQPPAPKENVQKEINPQSDNQSDNKPHSLFGSYYSIDDGLTATLLLNNKGPQTIEINPTLYSLSGQQLELPPVFVEPTSFQNINLSEWAGIGGEDFRQGSIKLFHRGKDLVLGAQIHLVDQAQSLSFEEKLTEIGNSDSRRLEGIWVMPSREANVKIALSNTTDDVLTVAASLTRRPHNTSEAKNFQLQPHETRILDLRRDFPDGEKAANSEAVALSLEHCGTKEALLARAFISEPERGYSNLAQFSNPLKGKSKEYQGVGFQLGTVAGERLTPVVVARNTAGTDANITGRVPYTRVDGTTGIIALEATRLRPNEIKLLDLRRVIQRSEQEQIKIAGLEIEYDTAEGSVRIAAHSQSTSRNQVFRVPMWDPFGQRSPTGGYPWQIENTSTTKTYIKNITDREQYYVAYLSWENDGRYMIGMKQIAPHQTIEIDLKQLRDEQIPDEAGEVIPLHVTKGQLKWSLKQVSKEPPGEEIRQALALIGRTEQIDVENGISSNYACQNCCGNSYDNSYLTPGGGEAEVDAVIDFDVYQRDRDCYNVPTPYYLRTPSHGFTSWSSSNTSAATVNDSIVTTVGAGDTTIKASWQDQINYLSEGYPCDIFLKEAGSCSSNYAESIQVIATSVRTKRKVKSQDQLLRPPCGPYCASFSYNPDPSASLTVKPSVSIDSFTAVGENYTAMVKVTVSKNPNNQPITLTLYPNSGTTGVAQFSNNSTSLTIQQTTNVEIKGITVSSTNNNMRLQAKFNNRSLDTEDFTVLRVTLSLRFNNNDTISNDNSARTNQQNAIGTLSLGGPFFSSGTEPNRWRHVIEIVGTVLPSNYSNDIILRREVIESRSWKEDNTLASNAACDPLQPTPCPDTSFSTYRDDSPSPNGKIYDIDSPGIELVSSAPVGTIRRRRTNFRQWATVTQLNGGSIEDVRVSGDIEWFWRISIEKNQSGNLVINNDISNDNAIGSGRTNISYNLQ